MSKKERLLKNTEKKIPGDSRPGCKISAWSELPKPVKSY